MKQTLEKKVHELSPMEIISLSRHSDRPHSQDYIAHCFSEPKELHGDRVSRDDPTIYAGFGRLRKPADATWGAGQIQCAFVGHRKGKDGGEIFGGSAYPEGHRKAIRKMKMAEKFNRPIVTFIDTPGAAGSKEAEERGQSKSIADNMREMSRLKTPIVSVIIGEGASGGALALGISDKIAMLENSYFSVIDPKGCAGICWKDVEITPEIIEEAARAMQITSYDNLYNGFIDEIIPEHPGGAHLDRNNALESVHSWIYKKVSGIQKAINLHGIDWLVGKRYEKLRKLGAYEENGHFFINGESMGMKE